jgi:hypothetical protein
MTISERMGCKMMTVRRLVGATILVITTLRMTTFNIMTFSIIIDKMLQSA